MKKNALIILIMLLLLLVSGCSTVYKTAVDERGTISIVSDERITVAIRTYFLEDKEMKGFGASIYSFNGNVFLVGEYENAADEEKAVKISQNVEGVKSVKTYLLPKKKHDDCGISDNLGILTRIKAKLIADTDIWSTNIDIKVVQCNVVLLGIVKSEKEIEKTIEHVKSVAHVKSLTTYLTTSK